MKTRAKWNGKHGRAVDLKALIAAKRKKSPAFKAAYDDARAARLLSRALAGLRESAGLTQRELAKRLGTSQAAISRLESPSYAGHSVSMLERYVRAVGACISISFRRAAPGTPAVVVSAGLLDAS